MDPQFVENLNEQVPKYDAFFSPLVPDKDGHPAIIKHCIRYGLFERLASAIRWFEIDPGEQWQN